MFKLPTILKRTFLYFALSAVLFLVFYFCVRLNFQPTIQPLSNGCLNQDVVAQLSFLKQALHKGADEDMQNLFPEGYLFIHALHGLAWANVVTNAGKDSLVYKKGVKNIHTSLSRMLSDKGRKPFSKELQLEYGAFHKGWTTYLLGKKLLAQFPEDRKPEEVEEFEHHCKQIQKAYNESETIYLESYHGSTWPADNLLCLASLGLHDQLTESQYSSFLKARVEMIKDFLDPSTGLIPHSFKGNKIEEGARGSSQSLMNVFLWDIDSLFAKEQYALYKTHFLESRLGLPGIREYQKGKEGGGDVDAGPVIWEIGGSASVVGIAASARNGDWELNRSLRNAVEAFGVPFTWNKKKKYLFGQLPVADAFIAWSHSVEGN